MSDSLMKADDINNAFYELFAKKCNGYSEECTEGKLGEWRYLRKSSMCTVDDANLASNHPKCLIHSRHS